MVISSIITGNIVKVRIISRFLALRIVTITSLQFTEDKP